MTASGSRLPEAPRAVLAPAGWLVLECGDDQAAEVAEGLVTLGYEGVLVHARTSPGRDRAVEGQRR